VIVLASVTNTLVDFATNVVADLGLPGIFLLSTMGSTGIPVPSEVTMLFAGYDVYQHHNTLVTVILAGLLGDLAGATIGYSIGYFGRLELVERHGAKFHLTPANMARGDRLFQRHGTPLIFFGRMIPLVRAFISFPAGAARMPYWRFLALTAAGSAIWISGWAIAGYELGPSYHSVQNKLHYVDIAIVVALVVGVVYLVVRRRRRRQAALEHS
jgi:membrane protein DedA with SNARE-associated domain